MHLPATSPSSSSCPAPARRLPPLSSGRPPAEATPVLLPGREGAAPGEPLRVRLLGGEERLLSGPTRVGSGPDNDWVLKDPFVSAQHLLLVPDGASLRLADRGSTNGTFVNGVRVERAVLAPGACVTLGRSQLRVCSTGGDSQRELSGDGAAMTALRAQLQRLAPLPMPALILGESGTGKELAARALHEGSGRRGAFVAVNCGALPRELIESELFGHEKGAFTGASARRPGCFLEADGGTLFLDEIGELPLDLQPRLLRALEQKAVRPVGAEREIAVDVRVVAATHRDLPRAVAEGRFREDLYYRLQGVELHLPPLRERAEDIPGLVRRFLGELAGALGALHLAEEELERLKGHRWPGNVRQLRHAVLRAAHLAGPVLTAADILPKEAPRREGPGEGHGGAQQLHGGAQQLHGGAGAALPAPALGRPPRRLSEVEREAVLAALRHTGNNRRAAAAILGVPKSTLCDRLKRMGL